MSEGGLPANSHAIRARVSLAFCLICLSLTLVAVQTPAPVPNSPSAHQPIVDSPVSLVFEQGICHFQLSGPQAGVNTDNKRSELKVPIGVDVILESTSRDFVYIVEQEFLKLELLAVPEMVFTKTVRIEHPGRYDLELSPLCGLPWKHEEPLGTIVAVEVK